jgi:WD40 repeat protein
VKELTLKHFSRTKENKQEKSKDVTTLDWNGDGTLLATGSYDGLVRPRVTDPLPPSLPSPAPRLRSCTRRLPRRRGCSGLWCRGGRPRATLRFRALPLCVASFHPRSATAATAATTADLSVGALARMQQNAVEGR